MYKKLGLLISIPFKLSKLFMEISTKINFTNYKNHQLYHTCLNYQPNFKIFSSLVELTFKAALSTSKTILMLVINTCF
jgi:hypothetical protein